MAGIPSHTKSNPPKRGTGSAREKVKSPQSGQRKSGGSSSSSQQREETQGASNLRREAVSVELDSELLFITTTSEPSNFKNARVQKEISQHVMKNYASKHPSGKDSSRGKFKEAPEHQSDEDTLANPMNTSSSSSSSQTSIGAPFDNMSGRPNIFAPSTLDSSMLTQNMIYPLNIDLSSQEFLKRLGRFLSCYMSEWFGAQAARLCGGGSHNAWKQWMPDEVDNDTLTYAQAFAAVTHINFLDPEIYKSERWILKGQAIQVIRETLRHQETTHVDGNIGAVLCMAVVAPLCVAPYENFVTHMNGLQRMVSIRGGLRVLRSNRMLHDALCLCDLSGAIIFRTNPVLVASHDLEEDGIADDLFNSPLGRCDDPTEPQSQSNLFPDSVQTMEDLYKLTQAWNQMNRAGANWKDSPAAANRCLSIERWLSLDHSHSATVPPNQVVPLQVREACRLAGLIYFRALFHNVPFSSPANIETMQGLRAALANSILYGWNGTPGLLLWALLVGTAAARSTSDEPFFAGHLSTTCFCLVANWHDVQQMLAFFFYLERRVEKKAAES